jgi:poly-gamma-glutamate capsule biosynthesis protein CapA/YwtB (metallophosphatase superfamily)
MISQPGYSKQLEPPTPAPCSSRRTGAEYGRGTATVDPDRGRSLVQAGATLVAGHSAHVFHGVRDHVLYDLGDFVDDYAIDPLAATTSGCSSS